MTLQSLPLCLCGISTPDSDASGEDALYRPSISAGEWAMVRASFLEQPDEVEPLVVVF